MSGVDGEPCVDFGSPNKKGQLALTLELYRKASDYAFSGASLLVSVASAGASAVKSGNCLTGFATS